MEVNEQQNQAKINVLELRNYLLKPNFADAFRHYFHSKFVTPMNELGGYTVGEFKIDEVEDRFVWLRGFNDMQSRLKFLNEFYVSSSTWKENGRGANEMIINSDNVHLLKPLYKTRFIPTAKSLTVVDFYICNTTLDKVIALFDTAYIPFLKTVHVNDISFWVSEMTENDFPRLPVFQDKNLLVTLTNYQDRSEYNAKQQAINNMPATLKTSMLELITVHRNLLLLNQNLTIEND